MIPFKNLPQNLRTPLFFAEVDNSKANSYNQVLRTVIIGQKISAGTATANVPVICTGVNDALTKAGAGSMLHLMAAAYFKADPFGEVWLLPIVDNASGVAATGTIAYTAAATANGVHSLYVAGHLFSIPISSSQTTAQIATAVAAAITADTNSPVTASATTTTVTLTAKNKGVNGNTIDIRTNYVGTANGEVDPVGLAYTITAMASGATNPVLSTAIAALATQSYRFIVQPLTDSTSMSAMTAYLSDTNGTWSALEQFYGHAYTGFTDTYANIITKTTGLNDQHTSVFPYSNSPTADFVAAADFAATAAVSLRIDPARPLQTLVMSTFKAPPLNSQYSRASRNTLLYSGGSTFTVNRDGTVQFENIITTYQTNSFGQPDNSYLEIETMYTLMAVLDRLSGVVTSNYPRMKLAADGTKFAPGSAIVTPSMIRGDIIAEYESMEYDGLVQNTAAFAAGLIVQINSQNPNRVDVLWPGTLIAQLRIFALLAQFRLQ